MWPNPHGTVDLVTLTEEIPNWKLRFFCSVGLSPLWAKTWY